MSLLAMQVAMRSWLQAGSPTPPRPFGERSAPGLRVYRNNYQAQLISCLKLSFPHTHAWLGDDAFFAACAEHVTLVAANSWTIDDYASDFPARLKESWPDDPEVFELAWLELALAHAFIAPDAPALTADNLEGVDWDSASLRLWPSLRLQPALTNAGAIWSALAAGDKPPAAEPLPPESAYLIWRSGFSARFRTIDSAERYALELIGLGKDFAEVCSHTVDQHGQDEGVGLVAEWLGRWIADGLICGIA
jgi:hypothetical protein